MMMMIIMPTMMRLKADEDPLRQSCRGFGTKTVCQCLRFNHQSWGDVSQENLELHTPGNQTSTSGCRTLKYFSTGSCSYEQDMY